MASQVAIKMLGTNGGGFTNANAAHPFENPTPLSNFLQMLSIFRIPQRADLLPWAAMVKNQKHGWAVWAAMFAAVSRRRAGLLAGGGRGQSASHSTSAWTPAEGNMEGKEVRFGIFNSALFATITTDASCGAVNSMHDSFTPLGGLVPLFNIQLGEIVFGGVGAGLYGMLVFVVLAVFIAGLMVGRTPGVSRQENRVLRREDGDAGASRARHGHSLGFTAWASRQRVGDGRPEQQRPARLQRNSLRLQFRHRQQRQRLCRPERQYAWYNTTLGLAMLHRTLSA